MDLRVSSTSASPKKRKFPLAEDSTHKLLSPVVSPFVLYWYFCVVVAVYFLGPALVSNVVTWRPFILFYLNTFFSIIPFSQKVSTLHLQMYLSHLVVEIRSHYSIIKSDVPVLGRLISHSFDVNKALFLLQGKRSPHPSVSDSLITVDDVSSQSEEELVVDGPLSVQSSVDMISDESSSLPATAMPQQHSQQQQLTTVQVTTGQTIA